MGLIHVSVGPAPTPLGGGRLGKRMMVAAALSHHLASGQDGVTSSWSHDRPTDGPAGPSSRRPWVLALFPGLSGSAVMTLGPGTPDGEKGSSESRQKEEWPPASCHLPSVSSTSEGLSRSIVRPRGMGQLPPQDTARSRASGSRACGPPASRTRIARRPWPGAPPQAHSAARLSSGEGGGRVDCPPSLPHSQRVAWTRPGRDGPPWPLAGGTEAGTMQFMAS